MAKAVEAKNSSKKSWTKSELEKIRNMAEDLYVNKGYTLAQISESWGVSVVSLSKWKKGRTGEKSWDERKSFVTLTPTKLKELLYEHALCIAEGKPSSLNADAISKTMRSIRDLEKETSPRIINAVLKRFDDWMVGVEPTKAVEITKYHRMFLVYCMEMED